MPLTGKGEKILSNLEKEYGDKKAKEVLYAGKNKGTFAGIDSDKPKHWRERLDSVLTACDGLLSRIDALECTRSDTIGINGKAYTVKTDGGPGSGPHPGSGGVAPGGGGRRPGDKTINYERSGMSQPNPNHSVKRSPDPDDDPELVSVRYKG